MNALLQSRLLRAGFIEHCPRHVRLPMRAITAPIIEKPDYRDEATRLAYIQQSKNTKGGVVAKFQP